MSDFIARCALCGFKSAQKACQNQDGKGPAFCPTVHRTEVTERGAKLYEDGETREFARQASIQEAMCYVDRDAQPHVLLPTKTRLEEICEFAQRMGYKRLGLAFCTGVHREAATFSGILEGQGFEVVSVICKVGCVPKERIGLQEDQKVRIGDYESMCNPLTQAEVLNDAETDFNIIMGLCVGHDSLFMKQAKAMTTVFAVKDRVLGHNPMAAVYTAPSYYQKLRLKRIRAKV